MQVYLCNSQDIAGILIIEFILDVLYHVTNGTL